MILNMKNFKDLQATLTQQIERKLSIPSQKVVDAVSEINGFFNKCLYASIVSSIQEHFPPRPSIILVEEGIDTSTPQIKIIHQSAFDSWRQIEDNSIQSIIVSPPYWNLRVYDIPDVIIGGNPSCSHTFVSKGKFGSFCTHCNAWQGQYGLEPNFRLYIEHTLLWCQEAWRVLKSDGIFFLNLGDSYLHKCKLLLPSRIAIALMDQGWILRNDNIWFKPNATPEPHKDRLSNKFEYVLMLSKKKKYYFDLDAIREPYKIESLERSHQNGKNPGDLWAINTQPSKLNHCAMFPWKLAERMILCSTRLNDYILDPFCGSGTTLAVAQRLGRKACGIDLGYEDVQEERLSGIQKN